MDDLKGRVALVTGASGGIGAVLSARLAEAGAAVGVHYAHGRDRAEAVVAGITEAGGRAAAFGADLVDPDTHEALIDTVEAELGPIDVFVANAGVGRKVMVEEADAALFDEAIVVNLRAPYLQARKVLFGMRERGWGRILFTSSVAGITGGIVGPHYAASKSGLHGLMHHLATQSAKDGVTVNAIAPALIDDTAMLPGDPTELTKRIPVGRLGTPQEVADLAMTILCTGYITNQLISIDGGLTTR